MSEYRRYSRIGILAATAVAIVAASFWLSLNFLNYLEPAIKELRPTTWNTAGKASYEMRDDMIVMRGPNYVYVETECEVNVCAVEFSMFVERADVANIQFLFFNLRGTTIEEPVIKDFSNVRGKVVELQATAPDRTRKIRLLIYTPKEGEAVAFRDPILRVKPIS